jgi:membrane protein required for colicin V production
MLIDIVFAVLIVIACIKGFQKGLIIALFSIVAFIIGLAAALKLSAVVAGYLGTNISVSAKWLPFISFCVVFFGVLILVHWGGKLIEKSLQLVLLGWVNRIGGILFYAMLYIIIFSIFLFYAEKLHLLQASTIQNSQVYAFVQPWGPKVIDGMGKMIPLFKDLFNQLENFFADLPAKIQ